MTWWKSKLVWIAAGWTGRACALVLIGGTVAYATIAGAFIGTFLKVHAIVESSAGIVAYWTAFTHENLHPIFGPVLAPLLAWGLPAVAIAGLGVYCGWTDDITKRLAKRARRRHSGSTARDAAVPAP